MKSQPYNNFWQRIHKSAKDKQFPLRVMFELTYKCNFKCKYCYVPPSYKKKEELITKEVFSILDQLSDIGCFYLGFTGGEPFIREDIMDILWYAKKKGFEVIIYTNGSLIDENTVKELNRLRPNKVDITIPAMNKDAFERISGVSGSRVRVFKTIDLLYKNGVSLGFKTCVLKENESQIKEIENFAHSLGALHRLDDMFFPCLDGSKEPYEYRGKLKEESVICNTSQVTGNTLHVARNKSNVLKQGCGLEVCNINPKPQPLNLFKCGVGVSQAAITPLGELKMCVMIDYPKYKISDTQVTSNKLHVTGQRANLKDAWEKLKELVASVKPNKDYKCDKCELEPYCQWCPAKGWLENGSFTSCTPESRRWAGIRRQRAGIRNC